LSESLGLSEKSGLSASWPASEEDIDLLSAARHPDPFRFMGPHLTPAGWALRAFAPDSISVRALKLDGTPLVELDRRRHDFFEALVPGVREKPQYRLEVQRPRGVSSYRDAYAFGPMLGPLDDHLLREGTHRELYKRLGAQITTHEGEGGVSFAVWAPNASRVSVVGDFNDWDGRRCQMRKRYDSGIWEIFIPHLEAGTVYKYEVVSAGGELQPLKADPFGFEAELRPSTATLVAYTNDFAWTDETWMQTRGDGQWRRKPMSVYECQLASWRHGEGGRWLTYDELADQLIPYVRDLGYTHIELLPVTEYPFDLSWGYQPLGLFAPTKRFGTPEEFARFVDKAHAAGIGVILDWVPAHFPTDAHGLAWFDGAALYEHPDPRKGFHPDWKSAIYDYGRKEVANFLLASALYWFDRYHVDGLRVDAVASMLYLDYSRNPGEWLPNADGGNVNYDSVNFLKSVNEAVYGLFPGAFMIAEESTAYDGITRPTAAGGVGFGFKWNMGWMHDTLDYLEKDPIYRKWNHNQLTFSMVYAYSENFILALSHDEVVYGKKSIVSKMPGDEWQKFANTRAYYGFMWGHPGKKLLFMGQEFGQTSEWDAEADLPWWLLDYAPHQGVKKLIADLNTFYRARPAMYARDCEPEGFHWIVGDDAENSVIAFLRFGEEGAPPVAVICNFTPVVRHNYRIGLPIIGRWAEAINTDAKEYWGSGVGNFGAVYADREPMHDLPASAAVTLPPLSTLFLEWRPGG
jgi:1,4-alpha-glucan branching enzyme